MSPSERLHGFLVKELSTTLAIETGLFLWDKTTGPVDLQLYIVAQVPAVWGALVFTVGQSALKAMEGIRFIRGRRRTEIAIIEHPAPEVQPVVTA